MTRVEQRLGDLGMAIRARELEGRGLVAVEAEPAQAVEDRFDRRLGRACAVGVLDAQQVLAAVVPGEQPIEQCGARAADVEVTRGRGSEARDDGAACRL